MILAGTLGLIFMVHPRAAGIALVVVVCAVCLLSAMGALGALMAAARADRLMDEAEAKRSADAGASEYAKQCIDRIRREESEVSASAVIADDDYPARKGGAS
jgi:FlaA1/EpsC-like NDP-sugar epimerase